MLENKNSNKKQRPQLNIGAVSGSCECGEHSKCVRKIHSNSEGKLWVENKEHFKCGKVKKQVNSMFSWLAANGYSYMSGFVFHKTCI